MDVSRRPKVRGPYRKKAPGDPVGRTAKYHFGGEYSMTNPKVPHAYFMPRGPAKRLRALAMVKDSLTLTRAQVAAKYQLSKESVQRTLSWAARAGLMVEVEDMVLQNFVPEAATVLMQALRARTKPELKEGDAPPPFVPEPTPEAIKIAVEVFKGTGVFRKPNQKSPSNPVGDAGDDLAKHIQAIRARALLRETSTEGELLEQSDSVGQLTTGSRIAGYLTPGSPTPGEPPVDGPDGTPATQVGAPAGASDDETGDDDA